MKKIYISIFIFLLLIAISSFSYAQTTVNVNTTYDFDNFTKQSFYDFAINNVFQSYDLSNKKYFLQYVRKPSDNSKYYACVYFFDNYFWIADNYFNPPMNYNFVAKPNIMAVLEVDSDNYYAYYDYSTNKTMSYFNIDTKKFVSVYTSWGDVPNENIAFNFDMQLINNDGQVITDSNFPNGDMFTSSEFPLVPGESGGGESGGGENEETGILDFIADFWSNLLHIVVPTDEQWQEVQDDWESDVLGKFNIQAWSYNANDYNYSNAWEWQDTEAPKIPITILGANTTIDMESFNVWLNTPFSFGQKKLYYSGGGGDVITTIDNGGLTIRKLINILLAIDLFILNIYLYNKFFSKED